MLAMKRKIEIGEGPANVRGTTWRNGHRAAIGRSGTKITELFEWAPTELVATRPMFMQYRVPGQTYALFYTHDGNKNVSEVVHYSRANGVAAHYEYAPFGETTAQVRQGGVTAYDFAAINPWRLSSEYADDASATVYYNYRHYEPVLGRWMSRDPIEDCAFSELRRPSVVKRRMRENILNVYLFVDNFFGRTDKLGLEKCVCGPDVTKWLVEQMNTNAQHPVIKTMREIELPRYIPFLNIGWVLGELIDFRNLVKAGAVWDFKASQSFTSQNCPKGEKCAHTVGLCGEESKGIKGTHPKNSLILWDESGFGLAILRNHFMQLLNWWLEQEARKTSTVLRFLGCVPSKCHLSDAITCKNGAILQSTYYNMWIEPCR